MFSYKCSRAQGEKMIEQWMFSKSTRRNIHRKIHIFRLISTSTRMYSDEYNREQVEIIIVLDTCS